MRRFFNFVSKFAIKYILALRIPTTVILSLSTLHLSDEVCHIFWPDDPDIVKRVQRIAYLSVLISTGVFVLLELLGVAFRGLLTRAQKDLAAAKQKIAEFEQARESLNHHIRSLVNGHLMGIADSHLGFGTQKKNSERISIYAHDPEAKEFYLLGRYSADPVFKQASRRIYPDNQGCIGEAWRNGFHFSKTEALTNSAAYRRFHLILNVPEDQIRKLNMKSRLYCGYRIDRGDGTNLAVVIIESTEPARFEEPELQEFLTQSRQSLYSLIETARVYVRHPSEATKEGF